MEVCINDQWGTVCDDSWDTTDATVICKQLGYAYTGSELTEMCSMSDLIKNQLFLPLILLFFYLTLLCIGGRAYSNAYFGTGSGPIFLDDIQCSSSSEELLQCFSSPILSHNCLHSADAGVGCEGMFQKISTESLRVAVQLLTCFNFFVLSSVYKWPAATCRRQCCK